MLVAVTGSSTSAAADEPPFPLRASAHTASDIGRCKQKVERLEVPRHPCRGIHWVKGSAGRSAEGGTWTATEAATLYWQLGASSGEARALSSKVAGESGGDPKAYGPPDGKGLLQVEIQFWPELAHLNLWRPIPNGVSAIHVLRVQGIVAWHAPTSAAGQIRPRLTR